MRTNFKLLSLLAGCAAVVGTASLFNHSQNVTPGTTDFVAIGSTTADITGDWPQWGGDSMRNNVPTGTNIPTEWEVGGFDRKTGAWQNEDAENILWVAPVGSQTYGNPVVADGRVFIGTNNSHGYMARYPSETDLGCMIAFDKKDGSLLWQHSSEKLATGRVHDWPLQGICCAPLVEGDRLWFVSSRGYVVCTDTEGFHDGEDDGVAKAGLGRLFKESPKMSDVLDTGKLPAALGALLSDKGVALSGRVRVSKVKDTENSWSISAKGTDGTFRAIAEGKYLTVLPWSKADDKATGAAVVAIANDLTAGMNDGKPSPALLALIGKRGYAYRRRVPGQNPHAQCEVDVLRQSER